MAEYGGGKRSLGPSCPRCLGGDNTGSGTRYVVPARPQTLHQEAIALQNILGRPLPSPRPHTPRTVGAIYTSPVTATANANVIDVALSRR